MADEVGCARPTGASVKVKDVQPDQAEPAQEKEVSMTLAKVGQAAPDFTAPTYQNGTFSSVTLSDYLGKWTMLCFYPGDFTFV
ncbi:MAG: redoxin domain-containing protein [Anaerolineales bacterium]|nr:redoxin domain-containing protein [Anaerolineales bacterium]